MDKDCLVDWNELLVYLKWAIIQYLDIKDTDDLFIAFFCKGLIPAMCDEVLKSSTLTRPLPWGVWGHAPTENFLDSTCRSSEMGSSAI